MSIQEKMDLVKSQGITVKFLALKTGISEAMLYAVAKGRRNLSQEKQTKLLTLLDVLISL